MESVIALLQNLARRKNGENGKSIGLDWFGKAANYIPICDIPTFAVPAFV